MNIGAGQWSVIFFMFTHIMWWFPHQFLELFEDMEYDWDDYAEEYEAVYYEGTNVLLNDSGKKAINQHQQNLYDEQVFTDPQTLLDELTWDAFGSNKTSPKEDPGIIGNRWEVWFHAMYPDETRNDEQREEDELDLFMMNEPFSVWDIYLMHFYDYPYFFNVEAREAWYIFWTEDESWKYDILIYPWFLPLLEWYFTTFRSFTSFMVPWRRIRAVGEYSRFNFRYKNWLLKWTDIPIYRGYREYWYMEIKPVSIYLYFTFRAILLFWWRRVRIGAVIW
jgi:hypothetical protein